LASFASIFDAKTSNPKHHPMEVLTTVGSAVHELEQVQDEAYADEANFIEQSDGRPAFVPNIPRDIVAGHFYPFVPPPVPEALSEKPTTRKKTSKRASKPRSWKTTITVTEHTTATGHKVYSAASTPLQRIQAIQEHERHTSLKHRLQALQGPKLHRQPAVVDELVFEEEPGKEPALPQLPQKQPFLNRLRIRQIVWEQTKREKMHAISVKRQRKLKMKKHKYKKLMKRTRNIRRRMGKL
jgi:hypothetical protein